MKVLVSGRLLAGGLGATALAMPFLGGKDDEDEGPVEVMDPSLSNTKSKRFL